MPSELDKPIQFLKNVGPKRAASFEKIGIKTVRDLLFYFPTKHLDRSNILSVSEIIQFVRNGFDGEVTVIGRVVDSELIRYGKKQLFKVVMMNKMETFECVWFQGIKYFKNSFPANSYFAISAKPVITRYGHLQFVHPDFDRINEKETNDFLNTGKIIPFYRIPKELKKANIGDFSLRKIIHNAVEKYVNLVEETLPQSIIQENKLLPLSKALKEYHFPSSQENIDKAKKRFKFEELFYLELLVAIKYFKTKSIEKGIALKVQKEPLKNFLDSLPFELTKSQLKVLHEIRLDLESGKPMNRLLQGDVGSGKTIVSLITAIIAVSNGYQAVLMAPTEILADQHFKNISKLIQPLGYNVSLLIGGQSSKTRNETLEDIKSGKTNIIIGTHALFEEKVDFNNLGLVIIDEQHRFGVLQRARLINKGISPHVLVMSATPIPRTLTMTIYGDLDVSIIDTLPSNRIPIKTYLRGDSRLDKIYEFIKSEVDKGNQAFIVYPLVEDSDKLDLKSAEEYYKKLSEDVFSNYNVGLIHGKMKWQDKENVMLEFANKKFDILISTTVIEVGIDIPDATVIVINDAYRFGLSQLHQLRGRIGRSNKQSYCILVAEDGIIKSNYTKDISLEYLSKSEIEKYKSAIRLQSMVKYNDGFKLSEIDLKLRGPGNIFGKEQSGFPELKHANIIDDSELLFKSKTCAFDIVKNDPNLSLPHNKLIKSVLLRNYQNHLIFSGIA